MTDKVIMHNRFLSSAIIFSLPFLPLSYFFEKKYDVQNFSTDKIAGKSIGFVSDKIFVPDMIAPGTNIGMWVWQRNYVVDPWERIMMLNFCRFHGVKSIFVQVHFDRNEQDDFVLADREDWNDLLLMANALGIRVEALDGAGEMAFEENHESTLSRLKAVLDFHTSQPKSARFSGIHYDIEPYTTHRWTSGEHQEVAKELLDLLTKLRNDVFRADPTLTFANDVPFWYDSDEQYMVNFNSAHKYLNEHIQDISDYIGIMSYRTKMVGENSISDIASGELAYGNKIDRPVYLSIETIELPKTPSITFFGKSAIDIASAIRELSEAQKFNPSFGGVYMHEYNTLRSFGEQWDLSAINN